MGCDKSSSVTASVFAFGERFSAERRDILFEQDYVMRLIKEMVRAILKLLFNIDTELPTAELLENKEENSMPTHLNSKKSLSILPPNLSFSIQSTP